MSNGLDEVKTIWEDQAIEGFRAVVIHASEESAELVEQTRLMTGKETGWVVAGGKSVAP